MRQRTLIGRRWGMIALDHFSAFAALLLQLERRLEEVDVEPCRRIEAGHHARCFDAIEAAVAHQAADDRTILLLDERLIVLLVRARACHFELLLAAPWHDDNGHEGAVVVEVHAAQKPANRRCACFSASTTSEPSRVSNGRHSVQPVAISTIVRVWINEPATDVPPWATMSTSQKPGGGLFQSLNVRIGTSRRIAE